MPVFYEDNTLSQALIISDTGIVCRGTHIPLAKIKSWKIGDLPPSDLTERILNPIVNPISNFVKEMYNKRNFLPALYFIISLKTVNPFSLIGYEKTVALPVSFTREHIADNFWMYMQLSDDRENFWGKFYVRNKNPTAGEKNHASKELQEIEFSLETKFHEKHKEFTAIKEALDRMMACKN